MTSSVAIITDSTANIPDETLTARKIHNVLQHLIWGTEDLLDLEDITPSQFYRRLATDPVHPKTSQPPAQDFLTMIEAAIKEGSTEAVIMTVSSKLSGTHASAVQAAEMAEIPVHVHDSRSVGMGLGWQVLAAADARDAGASAEDIVKAADKARQSLAVILAVDTLEYLHKGGRIGSAIKLIGSAINLKPQLVVNSETGVVDSGERTRTRKRAIDAIVSGFVERVDTSKPFKLTVSHAACLEDAEKLAQRMKEEYGPEEIIINELTPVLGTHGGPGTIALMGYNS